MIDLIMLFLSRTPDFLLMRSFYHWIAVMEGLLNHFDVTCPTNVTSIANQNGWLTHFLRGPTQLQSKCQS